ncbi:hypothetical protein AWZ03_006645 [Drosophila navojoa]|uniref:Uncharacterized protein n=1 Tax=Drosophila navojoa TaxID=7232 RepID=A0A484BGR0_DRONA|nr:uncharacterized protein LOC108659669 isoform X7 [Drosophila navojoa]TDG46941.1 hypothetical protein AWZ03_006645 [Drosophila navojoa]
MRIFGKMTHLLHISRCLSYHAPICRPHRLLHGSCKQWKKICSKCVCWHPTPSQLIEMLPSLPSMIHVQLYSQRSSSVFTPHTNVDMLRKRISFSGTPSESSEVAEATAPNVVPVGIIMPESKEGKQLKIVIVPLDLANQDIESLRNTLEALNQLRMHASEIDAFTNTMIEDLNKDEAALSANETPTAIEEPAEDKRKVSYFEGYVEGVDSGFSEDSANAVAIKATDTRKATCKASDFQNMGKTTRNTPADEASTQAAELRQLAYEAVDVTPIAKADNAATCAAASPEADIAPMTPAPYKPSVPSAPNQTPASPNTKPGSPPQTLPQTMPLGDPKELQISADSEEMISDDPHVDQISIEVPDALGQRLNDMAIASMHLSFEMDMTNVRDAILNEELAHKPEPTLGRDAMVFLETKVEADPENAPLNTVPLRFNALIKGMVQIDADKLDPSHLSDEQLPEYNDTVTSIAASICSTALQRGFASEAGLAVEQQEEQQQPLDQQEQTQPADQLEQPQSLDQQEQLQQQQQQMPSRMIQYADLPVSTDESTEIVAPMHAGGQIATHAGRKALKRSQEMKRMKQQHSVPTMSAVAQPIIEDQAAVASPQLKDGCKHPIIKKKKKCPKKCPLLDDPCKDDKCKRPQPKKPEKKAESTTEITASAGKKDQCGKKGAGKGGKDEKKKDPCAKFKKGGKGGDKKGGKDDKKGCSGKKDGKGGAGDKKDPCAKFKKGAKGGDKKGGAGGKDKKDPCAKKGAAGGDKKKDPCAKKGGAGGDKKKDPCAKKGGAGGDKKKDACAKKGGAGDKDKKDPCAVFKKNAKGGDKKKDPCKKGGDKKGGDKKGGDKKCGDKKGGKGDKKDPCAKFKKGSGGKGDGKDKKDPCKKKYSTFSSPVSKFYHPNNSHFHFTRNPKRFLSSLQLNSQKTAATRSASKFLLKLRPCFKTYTTRVRRSYLRRQAKLSSCSLSRLPNSSTITPARFRVYSTLVRRHYDGMPSPAQMTAWGITSKSAQNQIQRGYSKKSKKKKGQDGKCNALQGKGGPRDRKHIKARTSLRTDCYDSNEEGCPVNRCTSVCDTVKMPRKKCERGQKPPKPKMAKKPKKKLPAICMVGKKNKGKKGKGRKK